jgi:arginine/lysine/ornithine decarboxylase
LGVQTDIAGISKVCDAYGVPLLVDNAHGAYTAFLEESEHPLQLGADMCCDSAHKTLPVLTGGAYLHISEKGKKYAANAQNALSLFASTSPSYLILSSLDECNAYLESDYRKELKETVKLTEKAKKRLCKGGYRIIGTEKTKITICTADYGYTGFEIEEILREKEIYCEYADQKHIVFMVTPQNEKEDIEHLVSALVLIERVKMIKMEPVPTPPFIPKVVTTPRKAMLGEKEIVKTKDSLHRICASPTVSCPPAIPIVISGEEIDEKAVELFEYYGVTEIEVIK